MTGTQAALRQTPLRDRHVSLGARLVPFAGWEMPVQYEGVIAEHMAVRTSAGVFDVSHMGQLVVSGPGAATDLQRLLSNDLRELADNGAAQYTLLTNERGGIEDDVIVYRRAADSFLLVVNASNRRHDLDWIAARLSADTSVVDHSDELSMFAVQGPRALDALAGLGIDVRHLDRFRLVECGWRGQQLLVVTTGYTGEDGCEIMLPNDCAPELWDELLLEVEIVPCGLAARDTLRLEACYPLHGNDIGPQTSAVSAGLAWTCGFGTGFLGEEPLLREREQGPDRRLVALRCSERGIPRPGCQVHAADGSQVGVVTSGTMSPVLREGIALAYVDSASATVGTALEIDVRGRPVVAAVVRKPFYSKEQPA